MKKLLCIILLISSSLLGQVPRDKFKFQNHNLDYESILYGGPITDYYVFLIEDETDMTLERLYKNNCLEHEADYYLLNISSLNLSDGEKEEILDQFVNYVENKWLVSGTNIHLIMNKNRTAKYVKNVSRPHSSMQFKLIKNLNDLCEN